MPPTSTNSAWVVSATTSSIVREHKTACKLPTALALKSLKSLTQLLFAPQSLTVSLGTTASATLEKTWNLPDSLIKARQCLTSLLKDLATSNLSTRPPKDSESKLLDKKSRHSRCRLTSLTRCSHRSQTTLLFKKFTTQHLFTLESQGSQTLKPR